MRSRPKIVSHPESSGRANQSACRRFCWALAAVTFIGFSLVAEANRIDRIDPGSPAFSDHYFLSVNAGSPSASLTETGIDRRSTFRGRRDISLDLNGGTSAYSSKQYSDSFLELSNDANTSATLTLDYGADGDWADGPMNDRYSDRYNAIGIDVSQVNSGDGRLSLGSGRFTLMLRSYSGSATSINLVDFNQPGRYYFSYSDPGFAGFDFAHLDEVMISLATTTPGTDFRIDNIFFCGVIPESSTWSLFTLGGVGFIAFGWRRRWAARRPSWQLAATAGRSK